jgi:hypothetical protein
MCDQRLFEKIAASNWQLAISGTASPDLDRSAPDYLTPAVKSALAGGPDYAGPLRLRSGLWPLAIGKKR